MSQLDRELVLSTWVSGPPPANSETMEMISFSSPFQWITRSPNVAANAWLLGSLGTWAMAETDKDLEEAKRIMARMLRMPPKPHKAESRPGPKRMSQTESWQDAPKPKPAAKPAKGARR